MVEFAMRFVLSHADVDVALTGTINPDHLEANIRSMERGDLPEEMLRKARDIVDDPRYQIVTDESIPMTTATVQASPRRTPPNWAVSQRALIDTMERAAVPFVEHATRPDGTLIQRSVWTSMDGTDNGYEAFLSFSLFSILGGNEFIRQTARKEWEAVTWQYADYGTVDREFVTGFDWFHHSESYTYIYYLAMADPQHSWIAAGRCGMPPCTWEKTRWHRTGTRTGA